jgi:DNA-binding MarR family transcriptional regulator
MISLSMVELMVEVMDEPRGEKGAAEGLIEKLKEFRCVLSRDPMRHAIQFFHERDLSVAQVATLLALRDREERTISDTANEIGLSLAATSQLVERLVREGLVSRSEDPEDRRRKQLSLSAEGRALLESTDRAYFSAMGRAFDGMPDEVMRRLEAALAEAIEHLDQPAP